MLSHILESGNHELIFGQYHLCILLFTKFLRFAQFYGPKGILNVPNGIHKTIGNCYVLRTTGSPYQVIVRFTGHNIFEATPFQPKFGQKVAKSNSIFSQFLLPAVKIAITNRLSPGFDIIPNEALT